MACCASFLVAARSVLILLRSISYFTFIMTSFFKCLWRTLMTNLWFEKSWFNISSWSFHAFKQYHNYPLSLHQELLLCMKCNSQKIDLFPFVVLGSFPILFPYFQISCHHPCKQIIDKILGSPNHRHCLLLSCLSIHFELQ